MGRTASLLKPGGKPLNSDQRDASLDTVRDIVRDRILPDFHVGCIATRILEAVEDLPSGVHVIMDGRLVYLNR
jgi:hypothetical protein